MDPLLEVLTVGNGGQVQYVQSQISSVWALETGDYSTGAPGFGRFRDLRMMCTVALLDVGMTEFS